MNGGAFNKVLSEAAEKRERSPQERVAILLLSLGNPLGAKILQHFGAEDIKAIMAAASQVGVITRDDLEALIDDFAAQFGKALGIDTGEQTVRNLVEQAFPPEQLNTLLAAGGGPQFEPVWGKFQAGSDNLIVPYLLDEHPQTTAFIISNLEPDVAARCLAVLPRELRDTVTRRLLDLAPVTERVSAILQQCLKDDLLGKSAQSAGVSGLNRLAALLNRLDREQSSAVLDSLTASQPDVARELRGMVFSFEDIEQLTQPARLTLFDKVPTEQVIAALRGTPDGLRDAVLGSLSARSKRMVEAELSTNGAQPGRDTPQARRAIADLALQLSQNGEIALSPAP